MPTYPSPNPTLTLTFHLQQNCDLFRGGVGGQFQGFKNRYLKNSTGHFCLKHLHPSIVQQQFLLCPFWFLELMASDDRWNKHQNSQNESLQGDESRQERQTQFRFQFLQKLLFSQLQWCFHLWTFSHGAKQGGQTLLILYTKWELFSVEPRYNKGLRDWQNLFAISRFFFICWLLG